VITEWLFGITPTGFRKFTLNPSLPTGWNRMALKRVKAFQSTIDIEVLRQPENCLQITVKPAVGNPSVTLIKAGETASIVL